jgi:hypothetical protein
LFDFHIISLTFSQIRLESLLNAKLGKFKFVSCTSPAPLEAFNLPIPLSAQTSFVLFSRLQTSKAFGKRENYLIILENSLARSITQSEKASQIVSRISWYAKSFPSHSIFLILSEFALNDPIYEFYWFWLAAMLSGAGEAVVADWSMEEKLNKSNVFFPLSILTLFVSQ